MLDLRTSTSMIADKVKPRISDQLRVRLPQAAPTTGPVMIGAPVCVCAGSEANHNARGDWQKRRDDVAQDGPGDGLKRVSVVTGGALSYV